MTQAVLFIRRRKLMKEMKGDWRLVNISTRPHWTRFIAYSSDIYPIQVATRTLPWVLWSWVTVKETNIKLRSRILVRAQLTCEELNVFEFLIRWNHGKWNNQFIIQPTLRRGHEVKSWGGTHMQNEWTKINYLSSGHQVETQWRDRPNTQWL